MVLLRMPHVAPRYVSNNVNNFILCCRTEGLGQPLEPGHDLCGIDAVTSRVGALAPHRRDRIDAIAATTSS